jgi:hypothetical protein
MLRVAMAGAMETAFAATPCLTQDHAGGPKMRLNAEKQPK